MSIKKVKYKSSTGIACLMLFSMLGFILHDFSHSLAGHLDHSHHHNTQHSKEADNDPDPESGEDHDCYYCTLSTESFSILSTNNFFSNINQLTSTVFYTSHPFTGKKLSQNHLRAPPVFI